MQLESIDVFSPDFKKNPYPTYAYLRENVPVFRIALPDGQGLWLVTRYADALSVLKDGRFVKDVRNAMTPEEREQIPPKPEVLEAFSQNMLDLDAPDHTRLKQLVHKAFTPRMIEQLRDRVQRLADELLDAVEGEGTMDLIASYAYQLPITVIVELLGIPYEDRNMFRAWSDDLVAGSEIVEPDERQLAVSAALADYLRSLFALRRSDPRDDLISALVAVEEAGEKLNESELLAMIVLLLIAGHETTVNLLGNGMLALLQHPEQLRMLAENPALLPNAIEELLRYTSPVEMTTPRFASEDVELCGAVIPRGETVLVVLASANRDAEQFADPERLDITRRDIRHLAFGQGIHFCLGAPLARLEGQIGIATLLRRLPGLRLAVPAEELAWRPHLILRGLEKLPVLF